MYPGITVIKRDGRREPLDISKIRKYTMAACEGLDGVDYSELELDAKLQFRDGITTEEIQETLIKTAVDKIDIDRPNWNFVAARLFLYDLYHKVTGFTGYNHLREYFEKGESAGRILPGLKEKYHLDDLNDYIKPERDLQFTYLGIKTLYDRYIIKDRNNNPIELPQQLFMGVAMFLAQNETNPESIPDADKDKVDLNDPKAIRGYWAKKFYDVISKFEVMVATPTLSNARTTRHQLSSCYVGSMNDNIEGIFDDYKEMALLSKFGGGIGWDVSRIRALGSFIDNHKNAAGGVIPWLKITNDIAIAVDQLGTRKGAIAVYLEPWHMDVLDFLDLKKNSGEERRRENDHFPALWIQYIFKKRLKE
jgi:ribonucleoside-diphosphate reductase alpha chain